MNNEFIFYGTGSIPNPMYTKAKEHVEKVLKGEVLFCSDKNQALWDYKNIFPPEEIKKHKDATIVLFCDPLKAVRNGFRSAGIHNELKVNPRFSFRFVCDSKENHRQEKVCAWYKANKEFIEALYRTDDIITSQMLKQIGRERTLEAYEFMNFEDYVSDEFDLSHEGHYFSDTKLTGLNDFTFIDGGGYTGDSFESLYSAYGKRLKQVYAFEPDAANMRSYKESVRKSGYAGKISYLEAGMYDGTKTLYFSSSKESVAAGKIVEKGDLSVPVTSIDDTLAEVTGDLYIKMDVEGSEIKALQGATNTIKKYRPYMQVCLYHKMTDILDVPKVIRSICPDYNFYLREGVHPEVLAIPARN